MGESSDYSVCQCANCRTRPYEEEFRLAKAISAEVWKARPEALIFVYPHYFTGKKVIGLESAAARQPFDARWGPGRLAGEIVKAWGDDTPFPAPKR